ncbi:hypothetical protein POM88_023469 [Heracleum sosnowskyi]|uniref:Uncharacterized protein n=1 Tax=Heracleum sosnowskyi TaxID=360622 RepID=A0AAD8IH31_9APIA|nr:hypothetical protein POM88_023469 [Heracleum sosnowskyi]
MGSEEIELLSPCPSLIKIKNALVFGVGRNLIDSDSSRIQKKRSTYIENMEINMEFVNSVWCIKILSPQEVQQTGKQGIELLNAVPVQRLSTTSCDNYASQQESRNLNSGIASVGTLDY